MKIAYLAPEFLPTWGGVGTYSVELIRQLSRDPKLDIHVITPKRGDSYSKRDVSAFFDDRITIHNLSTANDGFLYNPKFQLSVLANFSSLQKREHFDLLHSANIVHMPDIGLKFFPPLLPSVTTIHTTLKSQSHINGQIPLFLPATSPERWARVTYPVIAALESLYFRRSSNFIAVSDWITKFLPRGKKARVIPNGVDTMRFRPRKSANRKPVVLFCGRLLTIKGLDILIRSMRDVLRTDECEFVFAGSGNITHWRQKMDPLSRKHAKFLQYVKYEDIHRLYNHADILVLPSLSETLPLTIIEAMASGLPVISTPVGGIPELVQQGKTGYLVPVGDSARLSERIRSLLRDESLRAKMGSAGRKAALERYDSKVMAEKTRRFYDEVLS